jgi:hypothetical protein
VTGVFFNINCLIEFQGTFRTNSPIKDMAKTFVAVRQRSIKGVVENQSQQA